MKLFYELIQVSIGGREKLTFPPSPQDWLALYNESKSQAILGVMLMGIARLPIEQRPPRPLFLSWIGAGEKIRLRNKLVNQRCCQLFKLLEEANKRYCVLKGQGNALMYPDPYCRNAGDIDVWLEGGKKKIVEFVHSLYPKINVEYHHMNFPVFKDVEVEVHYFPSFCYNKFNNRKLQKYFRNSSEEQFTHFVKWQETERGICVPTVAFNLVFQLSHMMRHFFTQGIGLRHAIDYYYLLSQDIDDKQKSEAIGVMKSCGMYRFFCAIVWVETEVLGLQKNNDIAPANEKTGKMVLQEMMKGGNFGKKYNHNKGNVLAIYARQMLYRMRFVKEFPFEPLWRPIALVWDYIKKRV